MPIIDMPQIHGAFTLDVTVRFDSMGYGAGQTVLDFGDASGDDNIVLAQSGTSTTQEFAIFVGGRRYAIAAQDAIVVGETADWTLSVDEDGVMSLAKDGTLIAEGQGAVPADVPRTSALVGEANTSATAPLSGVVSALEIDGVDVLAEDPQTGTDAGELLTGGAARILCSGLAATTHLWATRAMT